MDGEDGEDGEYMDDEIYAAPLNNKDKDVQSTQGEKHKISMTNAAPLFANVGKYTPSFTRRESTTEEDQIKTTTQQILSSSIMQKCKCKLEC